MNKAILNCAECDYIAKSATGLGVHRVHKHGYISPNSPKGRSLRPLKRPGRPRKNLECAGLTAPLPVGSSMPTAPSRPPAAVKPPNGKAASSRRTPNPPDLPPAECVNAAVRSLADALVTFVLAEVTASLQSSVVGLQPSVASLQQSALSLQPAKVAGAVRASTAPVTAAAAPAERRPLTAESSLHSLSDQQLKDRLGVAKAANNIGLCAKITNVLRMRDRSATVIANTHQEEM